MSGPLSPKKTAGYIWVPRELLLDAGVVEPTPDERAEAERRAAEYRAREAVRAASLEQLRRRLDAVTEQPARAILDLHAENARHECEGDDFEGYDGEPAAWPCRTVLEIAAHYGITLEGL